MEFYFSSRSAAAAAAAATTFLLLSIVVGTIESAGQAPVALNPENLEAVLKIPRDFCGQYSPNGTRSRGGRVIGGREAAIQEFPWQISLQKLRLAIPLPIPDWAHTCGGSILNEYWVLTAAHCVDGLVNSLFPGQLRAVIGTDRWRYTLLQRDIQLINVAKIVIHPDWSPRKAANDIALVRLAKPISFNERARPICLPTSESPSLANRTGSNNNNNYPAINNNNNNNNYNNNGDKGEEKGKFATIAGYGFTTDRILGLNILPNRLHTVTVPIVRADRCRQAYNRTRIPITDKMICAGMATSGFCSGALKGDSGSALITYENQRAVHTGIVSFSLPCRFTGAPDVYTRTSAYLAWIETVVRTMVA